MLCSHIADKEVLQEYYLSAYVVLLQKLLQKDTFSLHFFFWGAHLLLLILFPDFMAGFLLMLISVSSEEQTCNGCLPSDMGRGNEVAPAMSLTGWVLAPVMT